MKKPNKYFLHLNNNKIIKCDYINVKDLIFEYYTINDIKSISRQINKLSFGIKLYIKYK